MQYLTQISLHWFVLFFSEDLPDGVEFEVVGDIEKLKEDQKKEKEEGDKAANGTTNGADKNGHSKEKTDTGKFFPFGSN